MFVLISFFNLEEIGDSNLKELFAILVQNIPNENVTKSSQENYAKHLILFITRFTQRFGTQNLVSYFEMNHKGATEYFLNRDFNNVFELDSISKKKVVTYGICMLMTEGYSHFGINFLKSMTTNLINLLDKFYKSNILLSANDNLLIDNINFQTNSINKLQNTDVRVSLFHYLFSLMTSY